MIPGLVTTIIPVHNRPSMIREAVASVIAQDYRPIEVIVVDDGSTDQTSIVLAELAVKHAELLVLTQANFGPAMARENGRQHAEGEFIQYLDSDDYLLPNKISLQVAALRRETDAVAAYGATVCQDPGQVLDLSQAERRAGGFVSSMMPSMLAGRWWATSAALFRRTASDAAGPWSDLRNEEDWEYDCRFAMRNGHGKLVRCDAVVSVVRRHAGEKLSMGGGADPNKLAHRLAARKRIFALADLDSDIARSEEMDLFARGTFLVSRQCACQGYFALARGYSDLARRSARRPWTRASTFIWDVVGRVFGWKVAAHIANRVEARRVMSR